MRTTSTFMLAASAALLLAGCGGSAQTSPSGSAATTAQRPASPVKITLVSPSNGEVVHGTSVHVVVRVSGGTVTQTTTAPGNVTPTLGHVHLYFNNQLVYMSYTLQQDLPVHPGLEYTMYAEFVGQDHLPFNPRDVTPTIFFTVAS